MRAFIRDNLSRQPLSCKNLSKMFDGGFSCGCLHTVDFWPLAKCSKAENNFAQIQKEALTIVYEIQYIYYRQKIQPHDFTWLKVQYSRNSSQLLTKVDNTDQQPNMVMQINIIVKTTAQ